MRKAQLNDILRDTSRRRSGVKIVLQTDDTDFIAMALRALEGDGNMSFIFDASSSERLEQPIDLYARVVSVI